MKQTIGKISIIFTLAVALVATSVASVSAATPGWQTIGTTYTNFKNFDTTTWTPTHKSKGGKVALRFPNHYATTRTNGVDPPVIFFVLYEDDGPRLKRDKIGEGWYYAVSGAQTFSFDVSKFTDGVNRKAEIYAQMNSNYESPPFKIEMLD